MSEVVERPERASELIMKLNGFSLYEFRIVGDELVVRKGQRRLKAVRDAYHNTAKYNLTDDNGNTVCASELRLAYCLTNSVQLNAIKGKKVGGTVRAPHLAKGYIPHYTTDEKVRRLADFEYAFDMLRALYLTGDDSRLVAFANECRSQAIHTVSNLTGAAAGTLSLVWDDAVDAFLVVCRSCSFTAIKPLFGMLCKELKKAWFARYTLRRQRANC